MLIPSLLLMQNHITYAFLIRVIKKQKLRCMRQAMKSDRALFYLPRTRWNFWSSMVMMMIHQFLQTLLLIIFSNPGSDQDSYRPHELEYLYLAYDY